MKLSSSHQAAGANVKNRNYTVLFQKLSGIMDCLDITSGLTEELHCTEEIGKNKTYSIKWLQID